MTYDGTARETQVVQTATSQICGYLCASVNFFAHSPTYIFLLRIASCPVPFLLSLSNCLNISNLRRIIKKLQPSSHDTRVPVPGRTTTPANKDAIFPKMSCITFRSDRCIWGDRGIMCSNVFAKPHGRTTSCPLYITDIPTPSQGTPTSKTCTSTWRAAMS